MLLRDNQLYSPWIMHAHVEMGSWTVFKGLGFYSIKPPNIKVQNSII